MPRTRRSGGAREISEKDLVAAMRFAHPECVKLTPELVGELNWLHDDCAYRKALKR